jgi:hypothetical protein
MSHKTPTLRVKCVAMSSDSKASPEIRRLIDKINPDPSASTSQAKYEAIMKRKKYDLHCFLEAICLRLDSSRGQIVQNNVQEQADQTFQDMLRHTAM